jgi:ABC-type lipoprotein release transport system permease subunit
MRRLKILEYALSSLGRRKGKNLSIIVVFAFTISVLASILLLSHALREEASAILADAPDVVVQRVSAGRHDLISTEVIEPVTQIPGVGEVRPRYWGYYFDGITGANYTVLGIDDRRTVELEMVDGALPEGQGECAVGVGVSQVREVGIEDELVLVDSRGVGVIFEVVGTFRAESNLLTNDLVVMSNADVIEFFDLPEGRATDLSVDVFNPNEVQTVATKIKVLYPDTRPITRSEIIRTYDAVFHWRSGMVLTVFFSALIAFCILAWDKATGISAEERREIGILKAIGWSTSDVLELKFWEGAAISVTSFLLGLIAAFIHVFLLDAPALAAVVKGWSVLFPPFRLTPSLNLYQIFVMGFLTVVPYIASTVIPSWKAAITDPEEVIRA